MNRDIKDVIDSVDEKNHIDSNYERELILLKEEIKRLNFTIREQGFLIQEQQKKLKIAENFDIPEDVKELKNIIQQQRQEIKKRDKDREILEESINELRKKIGTYKTQVKNNIDNEELVKARKLIVQLTEENDFYNQNEVNAKEIIKKLTDDNKSYLLEIENLRNNIDMIQNQFKEQIEEYKESEWTLEKDLTENTKINEDFLLQYIEILKTEFQIKNITNTEPLNIFNEIIQRIVNVKNENEIMYKELEKAISTISELANEVNIQKKEISALNEKLNEKLTKIDLLNDTIENLNAQNNNLNQNVRQDTLEIKNRKNEELLKLDKELRQITQENDELKQMLNHFQENLLKEDFGLDNEKSMIKDLEYNTSILIEENEKLKKSISELKENLKVSPLEVTSKSTVNQCIPKAYQNFLFNKLFNILENNEREGLIDLLLNDLNNTKNNDIKRYIIDILSEFKDHEKIYQSFLEILKSGNWLIKLYIIKALSTFNKNLAKEPLERLLNDPDSDVREAATRALGKFT